MSFADILGGCTVQDWKKEGKKWERNTFSAGLNLVKKDPKVPTEGRPALILPGGSRSPTPRDHPFLESYHGAESGLV